MAIIMNQLLSVFILLVRCSAQTITSRATLPYHEPEASTIPQQFEDLRLQASGLDSNVTLYKQSFNNRFQRRTINHLAKRNNYCFKDDAAAFCQDSNLCCTNTSKSTGWCCWFTLNCDTGNIGCATPTVVFQVTVTTTSSITQYSSKTASVTVFETTTQTITDVNTVTVSNADTATIVDTITVTGNVAKRAQHEPIGNLIDRLADLFTTITSTSHVNLIISNKKVDKNTDQDLLLASPTSTVLPNPLLAKRQAKTTTKTVATVTVYVTTTVYLSSTNFDTSVQTVQVIVQMTSTLAINAKTTVHSTSTTTLHPSGSSSAISPSTTTNQNTTATTDANTSSNTTTKNPQLSIGAWTGIGIGAAFAFSLLAVLAFFIKKNKEPARKGEALKQTDSHNNEDKYLSMPVVHDRGSGMSTSTRPYTFTQLNGRDPQPYFDAPPQDGNRRGLNMPHGRVPEVTNSMVHEAPVPSVVVYEASNGALYEVAGEGRI